MGDGAIVNTCASVDHDCGLGDFAHVSAGVHMAGTMKIDSFTFVGVGATVIQNICSDCIIGAGAVVSKPIVESGYKSYSPESIYSTNLVVKTENSNGSRSIKLNESFYKEMKEIYEEHGGISHFD